MVLGTEVVRWKESDNNFNELTSDISALFINTPDSHVLHNAPCGIAGFYRNITVPEDCTNHFFQPQKNVIRMQQTCVLSDNILK